MKKLLPLLTIGILLSNVPTALSAEKKVKANQTFAIYYVDMQRIINESNKGKQAKSLLESKIQKAKDKIKKMEEEIKKIKEELKSPVLSKQAKSEKETQLQQKIRDLQRFKQDAQIEIANLEKQYTMEIINDVVKLIKKYRKEKNIPMIVEVREAGIIAGDPKYDLTDKIINLYNKQAGQ